MHAGMLICRLTTLVSNRLNAVLIRTQDKVTFGRAADKVDVHLGNVPLLSSRHARIIRSDEDPDVAMIEGPIFLRWLGRGGDGVALNPI